MDSFQKIKNKIDLYLAEVSSPQRLDEISYSAFSRLVSENSNKERVKRSFKVLNRKLDEMEQLISHVNKFKASLDESDWAESVALKEMLKEKLKSMYKEIKNL